MYLTFTAGFGLVPNPIFGAVQHAVSASSRLHQVTGVTAVGHRVVEGELASYIDSVGYRPRVSTADHYRRKEHIEVCMKYCRARNVWKTLSSLDFCYNFFHHCVLWCSLNPMFLDFSCLPVNLVLPLNFHNFYPTLFFSLSPPNPRLFLLKLQIHYPTRAVWGLSGPRPVCCAVSGGQARRFEPFPACVSHRAAEGDAVAEDDPAVRRSARVPASYSWGARKY